MRLRKIIAWANIVVVCVFALAIVLYIAQDPEGRRDLLTVAGLVAGCVVVAWAICEVVG